MENNLQHEDLLIKLRAKLNEEKIKLWEPPYLDTENLMSQQLQELAKKYAADLSLELDMVTAALHELQLHSIDRVKANDEFKETGLATFRIKVNIPKEKSTVLKIQKKLDVLGSELISAVAAEIGVTESRVKLISNGKIVTSNLNLNKQNVKNGAMLMAIVLEMTPDEVKKEDNMYIEMKTTRDDAALLSEYVNELADDDEYIKLEDQSGKTVELPAAERKSLLVGLALHERGRAAIKQKDYSLALVLLLDADRQFNECRSSLLQVVDNWGILQLDIAWCYAGLRSVSSASDAAVRLAAAEQALRNSYGNDQKRLQQIKGSAANERVLLMRLYLLQGIVAFHQNKRAEAKVLLDKAEIELNGLRVDEAAVNRLMELGWTRAQARVGLRGAAGDPDQAHLQLAARADQRAQHRRDRRQRLLGVCSDGSPVNAGALHALVGMGFVRKLSLLALRHCNNSLQDAIRILQTQPELLGDISGEASSTGSSEESPIQPDNKMIAELEAMGYSSEEVRSALQLCNNELQAAVELLVSGINIPAEEDGANPSTSNAGATRKKQQEREKRRRERELALHRLSSAIRGDEDDYLDTSLLEEEQYLAEYKSLL
ncbi:NEDD8 ultimate buster 1 [Battus philenor]|uniref:NEDD8 ultimate buster 1 n=1 Tax=Battus philenor TaxID=42288 RepID=UPI0035CF5298